MERGVREDLREKEESDTNVGTVNFGELYDL